MHVPLIALLMAVAGALFLSASAFLGVTAFADWTMIAAGICLVTAVVVFLGWFLAACISEIRKA